MEEAIDISSSSRRMGGLSTGKEGQGRRPFRQQQWGIAGHAGEQCAPRALRTGSGVPAAVTQLREGGCGEQRQTELPGDPWPQAPQTSTGRPSNKQMDHWHDD